MNSNTKWTFDAVMRIAAKYPDRRSFRKNAGLAYQAAVTQGWLNYLHKPDPRLPRHWGLIWTREAVGTEAAKYNRRSDFKKGNGSAYSAALKNGWLNELFRKDVP